MIPTAKTDPLNNWQRLKPSMRAPPIFVATVSSTSTLMAISASGNSYQCRTHADEIIE